MEEHEGSRRSSTPRSTRTPLFRWSLRALLLMFIPIGIVLGYMSYVQRQQEASYNAWKQVEQRVIDINFYNGFKQGVMFIPRKNLTDEDLIAFIPYFNGYAYKGMPGIVKIRLNGSNVSPEAIERFRKAVPSCEVEP
jgi:hypothetical protein